VHFRLALLDDNSITSIMKKSRESFFSSLFKESKMLKFPPPLDILKPPCYHHLESSEMYFSKKKKISLCGASYFILVPVSFSSPTQMIETALFSLLLLFRNQYLV